MYWELKLSGPSGRPMNVGLSLLLLVGLSLSGCLTSSGGPPTPEAANSSEDVPAGEPHTDKFARPPIEIPPAAVGDGATYASDRGPVSTRFDVVGLVEEPLDGGPHAAVEVAVDTSFGNETWSGRVLFDQATAEPLLVEAEREGAPPRWARYLGDHADLVPVLFARSLDRSDFYGSADAPRLAVAPLAMMTLAGRSLSYGSDSVELNGNTYLLSVVANATGARTLSFFYQEGTPPEPWVAEMGLDPTSIFPRSLALGRAGEDPSWTFERVELRRGSDDLIVGTEEDGLQPCVPSEPWSRIPSFGGDAFGISHQELVDVLGSSDAYQAFVSDYPSAFTRAAWYRVFYPLGAQVPILKQYSWYLELASGEVHDGPRVDRYEVYSAQVVKDSDLTPARLLREERRNWSTLLDEIVPGRAQMADLSRVYEDAAERLGVDDVDLHFRSLSVPARFDGLRAAARASGTNSPQHDDAPELKYSAATGCFVARGVYPALTG